MPKVHIIVHATKLSTCSTPEDRRQWTTCHPDEFWELIELERQQCLLPATK